MLLLQFVQRGDDALNASFHFKERRLLVVEGVEKTEDDDDGRVFALRERRQALGQRRLHLIAGERA